VFIGGGYDNSFAPQEAYGPDGPPPQQQPNVTVVYPPQQQRAAPVMIQPGPDGEYNTMVQRPPATIYETPRPRDTVSEPEPAESNRYLLAFKDHTIYSAVAYWVDGDTVHYFTTGNTHNQASLSLIDRELTERLNRELGIDFKLPPAK
jgi:endonuclease YncB( thermonuclease family)